MDLKDLRVLPGGVVRNMESGFGMSYSRNPATQRLLSSERDVKTSRCTFAYSFDRRRTDAIAVRVWSVWCAIARGLCEVVYKWEIGDNGGSTEYPEENCWKATSICLCCIYFTVHITNLRHSRIAVVIFSGRGGSHTASSVEDVGLIGFLIVSIISIVVACTSK